LRGLEEEEAKESWKSDWDVRETHWGYFVTID
jgi:hypothetical protein